MGVMTNIPEGFRPLLAAKTPEEHELTNWMASGLFMVRLNMTVFVLLCWEA